MDYCNSWFFSKYIDKLSSFYAFLIFLVAHKSIPKKDKIFQIKISKNVKNELQNSGKKMVLTTFSSALISELDIVLLGLFYTGPILGVLAWSRRILEIIFQLLAASLDILFPELSKTREKSEVKQVRSQLKKVFFYLLSVPILYFFFSDFANIYLFLYLEEEFDMYLHILIKYFFVFH